MTMLTPYKPDFADPYPPKGWKTVANFRYRTPLVLYRDPISQKIRRRDAFGDDADYIVYADYTVSYEVDGNPHMLTVPSGMLTDLATVPTLLRSFVGKVGRHLEASIVHDFLYLAWQYLPDKTAERHDWEFADAVMAAGLVAAQVSRNDRFEIKLALQAAGWEVYEDTDPGPHFVKVPPLS